MTDQEAMNEMSRIITELVSCLEGVRGYLAETMAASSTPNADQKAIEMIDTAIAACALSAIQAREHIKQVDRAAN